MKSLKFLSLILLCATSCLGLILPALGVVPFPSQFVGANASFPDMTVGGTGSAASYVQGGSQPPQPTIQPPPGSVLPPSEPWRGATPSLGLSNSMGGGPMSPNSPISPSNSATVSNTLIAAGYPANTGIGQENMFPGSDSVVPGTKHKVGMGLWLLLAPLWLLSLFVWSVAPNPSSGNRPSFRRST